MDLKVRIFILLTFLFIILMVNVYNLNILFSEDEEVGKVDYKCKDGKCRQLLKIFPFSIVDGQESVTHIAFTIDVTSTGARTIQTYTLQPTTQLSPTVPGIFHPTSSLQQSTFYDIFINNDPSGLPEVGTTPTFTWDSRNSCSTNADCDFPEVCKTSICLLPTSEFEDGTIFRTYIFAAQVEAAFITLQGTTATTTNFYIIPSLSFGPEITDPTCTDGIQNQGETDIDCGGFTFSNDCPRCENGQMCNFGISCLSNICDFLDPIPICLAVPPTCSDGIRNQGETDIDCGGLVCSACTPKSQTSTPDSLISQTNESQET